MRVPSRENEDLFLLRGLLDKQWLTGMCGIEQDKPLVRLTQLYIGLWKILFHSVWETRNTLLHGNGSIMKQYEQATMIRELAEWKHQGASMIGSKQPCLVNYSMHKAMRWSTNLMQENLSLLLIAAQNYKQYCAIDTGQIRLTEYFTLVTFPMMTMYNMPTHKSSKREVHVYLKQWR